MDSIRSFCAIVSLLPAPTFCDERLLGPSVATLRWFKEGRGEGDEVEFVVVVEGEAIEGPSREGDWTEETDAGGENRRLWESTSSVGMEIIQNLIINFVKYL